MKKNFMMRFASLVLVLTLLSTCAISGTFAKYTTSDEATDSAQVAKWGVNVSVNAGTSGDAFLASYTATDTTYSGNSVQAASNTTYNLVAPGTSGTLATVSVSGTPEVAVRMTYTIDFEVGESWNVGTTPTFYCPIVVTIKENTTVNGLNYSDATTFEEAVEDAIAVALVADLSDATDGTYVKDYAPNASLTASVTPTWAWAFTGTTGTAANQSDVNDTELGNDAVTDAADISFSIKVDATQID